MRSCPPRPTGVAAADGSLLPNAILLSVSELVLVSPMVAATAARGESVYLKEVGGADGVAPPGEGDASAQLRRGCFRVSMRRTTPDFVSVVPTVVGDGENTFSPG